MKLKQLNEVIAIRSNQIFATMGFFWFCLIFSLIPLKWPATMAFVQYASSGVLQLIALPLLGVGTILAARASDRLSKEQHDAVIESHKNIVEILSDLAEMLNELHEIKKYEQEILKKRNIEEIGEKLAKIVEQNIGNA